MYVPARHIVHKIFMCMCLFDGVISFCVDYARRKQYFYRWIFCAFVIQSIFAAAAVRLLSSSEHQSPASHSRAVAPSVVVHGVYSVACHGAWGQPNGQILPTELLPTLSKH